MKKVCKTIGKILLGLLIALIVALVLLFVIHRILCISGEKRLEEPLGQLVEVDGGHMSVYTEGEGERTLVFLSGFGVPSPILDFKGLYSKLSGEYRIAVVEKFGYGYSDDTDQERSVETLLSQTRQALIAAGVEGPYVLCPHSFSGNEAIYWAQTYPEEVEAMVFLDTIVPGVMQTEKNAENDRLENLIYYLSKTGITRLCDPSAFSPAVECGHLTEEEAAIYADFVNCRFRSKAMLRETQDCYESFTLVAEGAVPEIPMLLCIADMGYTDPEDIAEYRKTEREYPVGPAVILELDCPHSAHNYEAARIAEEIRLFLTQY